MSEYVVSFVTVATTMALGSMFTNSSVKSSWYECIKPSYTPPKWVFPIVWTTLYFMLFLAFAIALKAGDPVTISLFVATFVLNVAWCYFYFKMRNLQAALFDIALLVALAAYICFRERSSVISYLVAPYLLWISFAATLNAASLQKTQC